MVSQGIKLHGTICRIIVQTSHDVKVEATALQANISDKAVAITSTLR